MGCRKIVFGSLWLFPGGTEHPIAGRRLSFPLFDRQTRKKKKMCLASTEESIISFLEYDLNSSIESLRKFLAVVPNAPEITALALALTAVGSSVVYRGRNKSEPPGIPGHAGGLESWFLTLNPTPFNKFVVARCPSICFVSESAVDEDVNLKLNLDSHQVVTLHNREFPPETTRIDYQRRCVPAEDGGVLALDWPVSLELEADHGLDTTIVLVPGTAKGSGDETVKFFVQRALKAGYFPVVLNPRGCGESPLTTPRIYSAGDSDDIRVGVSYISRLRPWTTLMGIGWGYGANMLTKYLGEEENLTPLTAAVSINNPFDLNEATKFMKTNRRLHEEVTDGFVEILKLNKMLFQGQRNLDVAGGVIAASVREFENAVSRPVNGSKTLEIFYRAVSSGRLVERVKTPLLCIQDASAVPMYSIPRAVFEGNPYTTLLYTPLESNRVQGDVIVNLSLEWMAAVELALLKGRHPLLHGLDLTIKPSKEWSANAVIDGSSVIEVQSSEDAEQVVSEGRLLKDASSNGGVAEHEKTESKSSKHSEQQQEESAPGANATEQGQVLQAAKTVFGALDVAMPGTLSDEMKDQVLEAVNRGESIITALENAVPENVRDKMATAVSAAVQARGMSLQMVGFGKNFPPPTLPAGLKESIQEKLGLVVKGDTPTTESSESASTTTGNQEAKQETSSESESNNESKSRVEKTTEDVSETPRDNSSSDAGSGGEKPEPQSQNTETDAKTQAENTEEPPKRAEAAAPDSKPTSAESPGRNSEGTGSQQRTPSSINMQQAFQALTGLDDSTQMAVNNVFGVLEGMLEQIQKEKQVQNIELQRSEPTALPQMSSAQHGSSKPAPLSGDAEQTDHQSRDELRDVQSRLKKTRISGFILHDDKVPMKGEAAPAADFCRTSATNVVLEAIKLEVQRRIGAESMEGSSGLKEEVRHVAEAVLKEVQNVRVYKGSSSRKVLSAEGLVNAVALAFRETATLKQVIPFGVLVGVILASLVNSFVVVTDGSWQQQTQISEGERDAPVTLAEPAAPAETKGSRGGYGNVVHAVTAAMGATAALANSGSNNEKPEEEEEGDDDSYNENIVSNIAEKAFSIAAPVVPTKDGQIDHERLVSMLTDISQKAGFLNFLGKAALLWGGLRGAMGVTDRLLVFLRISEKPLHLRLAGFVGMVILLWSPVFVPLLPTLLSEWASRSTGGVAQCASAAGLYGAVVILVIIWGKKIRGYEQPLQSYGLTLSLNKLKLFGPGLVAGCAAVSILYSMFNQFGFLSFVPSFLLAATFPELALSSAKLFKLILEGLVIGVCISAVEELLFRSWLTEEIAVDLGQQKAILLSSFVFAILHRTPSAIPGLWFLGIALAGARSRASGNLALPIGLHAGLVAANFVFTCGGFIVYGPAPNWMTGVHAGTPLAGALGASVAGIFALLLYPWKLLRESNSIVSVV